MMAGWEFDATVAVGYEDMLRRSIPDYETMRALVLDMARRAIWRKSLILDLGVSLGETILTLAHDYPDCRFVGYDLSPAMLEAARERFRWAENATLERHDLCAGLPHDVSGCSLVLSVLTLQFIPVEHRQKLIADVYRSLQTGGRLIVVEKVLGGGPILDNTLARAYHDLKRANGYSETEIAAKRELLDGVMVPLEARTNERWLRAAGFSEVECFWRALNFAGWVAYK